MKKYLYYVVCFSLCLFFACSCHANEVGNSFNESDINRHKGWTIIDSGEYFTIYKGNITQVYFEIYSSNGTVVKSGSTDRPLAINMLNSNIVDISTGMGSGLTVHQYYNVDQNIFSENYSYVVANQNNLVAYIEVPPGVGFENRKVVIRDIFDKDLFFKEYQLDFSNVDTPVIQAIFSEDGTELQLTYLSGEDQTQLHVVLSLVE